MPTPSLLDLFIVMKPADVRRYSNQSDREYFAKPVLVQPSHSCRFTRMRHYRDPARDCVFPVEKESLRNGFNLTNKQRLAAGF
jgi:hypothetical protein